MKNRTPDENFLDAVLLEAPAHEASLRVVRRAARRRRWNRHLRHGALTVLVLAIGIMLLPRRASERPSPARVPREASYVVHSGALPAGFVVKTRENSVPVVTTIRTGVEFFSTANTLPPERIDDEVLLQLAPGAVLVRHQAGPAELIFPNDGGAAQESSAGHE